MVMEMDTIRNDQNIIGINICPYCKGTDIKKDNKIYETVELNCIILDIDCENCGKTWQLEYLPIYYYTHEKNIMLCHNVK
jgi:transposase-like protein